MEEKDKMLKFIKHQAWLVWLSGLSANLRTKGLPVRFSVRAHAWDAGQAPRRGCARRNHILCFSPSFSSFPLSLKIHK